jgi:hypothetical protein
MIAFGVGGRGVVILQKPKQQQGVRPIPRILQTLVSRVHRPTNAEEHCPTVAKIHIVTYFKAFNTNFRNLSRRVDVDEELLTMWYMGGLNNGIAKNYLCNQHNTLIAAMRDAILVELVLGTRQTSYRLSSQQFPTRNQQQFER